MITAYQFYPQYYAYHVLIVMCLWSHLWFFYKECHVTLILVKKETLVNAPCATSPQNVGGGGGMCPLFPLPMILRMLHRRSRTFHKRR